MSRVSVLTLGCPKNRVDSEIKLGLIQQGGHTVVNNPENADVILVNTCCFIDKAKEETVDTILAAARLKQKSNCRRLIVSGCMVQRNREELKESIPEVDVFLGLDEFEKIGEVCELEELIPEEKPLTPSESLPDHTYDRVLTTPEYSAYLKISDGCNNSCSFCVIPDIRGRYRSRNVDSLVKEAKSLSERGVKELNLVAQDSTFYGVDRKGDEDLPKLLGELSDIRGLEWIRCLYFYPGRVTDRLLDTIAGGDNICNYVDIPLQHISERILEKMNRRGDPESYKKLIERIRRRIPGVSLRTSFIVGFPGETQQDFQKLYNFCEEMEFDNLGVFTYSKEEGTEAAEMDDDIPGRVKEERKRELRELHSLNTEAKNRKLTGRTFDVLCERPSSVEEYDYEGRTSKQAPEIDGKVYFHGDSPSPGEIKSVKITGTFNHHLTGELSED